MQKERKRKMGRGSGKNQSNPEMKKIKQLKVIVTVLHTLKKVEAKC